MDRIPRPNEGQKKSLCGESSLLAGYRVPRLAGGTAKDMLGQPLPASSARETHPRLSERGQDVLVFNPELFGAVFPKQQGTQFFSILPQARHSLHQTAPT